MIKAHLFFFVGMGELYIRWRVAERELDFLNKRYLPDDMEFVYIPPGNFPRSHALRGNEGKTSPVRAA